MATWPHVALPRRGERAEFVEAAEKRTRRTAERPQNVQVWLPRAEELQAGKVIGTVLSQARALLAAVQEAFAEASRVSAPPKTRRQGTHRRAAVPAESFSPDWAGEVRS